MNWGTYFISLSHGLSAKQALIAALPIPDLVDMNIKMSFLDGYLVFRPQFLKN